MTTRTAHLQTSEIPHTENLLLAVPDSDFRNFLGEVDELLVFAPEIAEKIEQDLDIHAKKKKRVRLADSKFNESQTSDFPDLEIAEQTISEEELELAVGRPRMTGAAVYLFLMLRGFLGSFTSIPATRFLLESMSLRDFLQRRELKMPAWTTILENVNALSSSTLNLIFDKQIEHILGEELDDFKQLTIDSTSVKANSAWPTDGKIIIGLLGRVDRLGQQFEAFGLSNFNAGWLASWHQERVSLEFKICMIAGKPKSRGKMKRHYRRLINSGKKSIKAFNSQLVILEASIKMETLPPSRRELLTRILKQIKSDLADAQRVIDYCDGRVFNDEKLPSTQKILSLSDGSAAYIIKGGRDAVIGYKPQLVRSEKGFVTSLTVPEGNAADSIELEPAIRESIQRTGVIAELVSTDDGYASKQGRDAVLGMGVKIISISGAKGKKITALEDWESETYRTARRNRSAVESLMFTIKDGFEFGKVGRRGIDAVRAELTEKVLAYNCCRIILMKKRRAKQREEGLKRSG